MSTLRRNFPKHYDLLGVTIGHRSQQQFVYDGKDCGVGANSQGQGQHRNYCKTSMLCEYSCAVANVLYQRFNKPAAFDVVGMVANIRHVTKTPNSCVSSLCWIHSRGDVGFGLHFNVSSHLTIYLFNLSLIHISEPTRLLSISYAVFCLKKK